MKSALSTILLFKVAVKHVRNPHLIVNYDATQFSLSVENSEAVEVIVPKNAKEKWKGKPISTDPVSSSKDLDFAIK